MTTKIPNNVMKPPKGFEYVTEQKKIPIVQIKRVKSDDDRIAQLESMIFAMQDEVRVLKRNQKQQLNSSNQKQKRVWMEDILDAVCKHFNVGKDYLLSPKRYAEIVEIRSCFINLCYELTNASQPAIGRYCGGRDHTTIIHHVRLKRNKSNCWDIRTKNGLDLWNDFNKLSTKLKAEAEPDNE